MMRSHTLHVAVMACGLLSVAGAAPVEPKLVSRPGWSLHAYRVDPGMFLSLEKAPSGELAWKPGIKPLSEVDGLKRNWDLREYLYEWGVIASAATLDVVDRRLTVYASDEEHELLEQMLQRMCCGGTAFPLHVEVTLVEFEAKAEAAIAGRTPMELRALAGAMWTIRESSVLAGDSGQTMLVENLSGGSGTRIEMDAVAQPDWASFGVTLHYRHTGKIGGTETVLESEVKTQFSTVEETGAVAKVWALEPKAGGDAGRVRYAALIVRPSARHPGGRIVREAIRR